MSFIVTECNLVCNLEQKISYIYMVWLQAELGLFPDEPGNEAKVEHAYIVF